MEYYSVVKRSRWGVEQHRKINHAGLHKESRSARAIYTHAALQTMKQETQQPSWTWWLRLVTPRAQEKLRQEDCKLRHVWDKGWVQGYLGLLSETLS